MRHIDIEKRPPWHAHVFAFIFALGAAVAGWYVPQALTRLCGDDPWHGWAAIWTAFVCLIAMCAGFGFGLLFGYGIALRVFANQDDSQENEDSPVPWQD